MNICILRETKIPADRRAPFTPEQCRMLMDSHSNLRICVQPSSDRCFSDDEYKAYGIEIREDISASDILFGVKEVPAGNLIPFKTYMFFSHTAKKQKHNRELLRALIKKNIRMIDYEYLTNKNNDRIVAFGRWAGLVGGYNALRAYGIRYNMFSLLPAWQCADSKDVLSNLSGIPVPEQRVVITGGGRVAKGAMEILDATGFARLAPEEFLITPKSSCYTQLDPEHYVKRIDNKAFDLHHFYHNPKEYENNFLRFARKADMLIACHYWNPDSPVLMMPENMRDPEFSIKIIADVSCDIDGPIPSTLRVSKISDPFYGYNPETGKEGEPFHPDNILVMAVDNLPGELPRDASEDFGRKLAADVVPLLTADNSSEMLKGASITENGRLTPNFSYLQDFLEGRE